MSKGVLGLLLATLAGAQTYVGSQACAECHAAIAKSYAQTPMAQAAGRVSDLHLPDGQVLASKANVTYSVKSKDGTTQLSYRKNDLEGSKTLQYYIGSGAHGRGFIFAEQGKPFQAPVAYYGPSRGWDVAPGYEGETSVFLARKVETACLACHSSGPKPISVGLFQEGAVSCERCHGPGQAHIKAVRSGQPMAGLASIVNPAKLGPERRDSVCARCHLTGETRVLKAGRTETSFQPGDILGDYIIPFVWAIPDQSQFKAVGHFEGLWQSKCKRTSGDRLSCLTCHDPHANVPPEKKVAYYRAKCLSCHQESNCQAPLATRKSKVDSCITCHMPQRTSTDGQHTAFTDHSIRRVPIDEQNTGHSKQLVAFWPARATERDRGLADADTGNWQQARQELLNVASPEAAVSAQLAYSYDMANETAEAAPLYETALNADPENLVALTNYGIHLARRGDLVGAVKLWKRALAINPGLLAPGLNLARVQWRLNRRTEAQEMIRRVLSLNPDSEAALALQKQMQDSIR